MKKLCLVILILFLLPVSAGADDYFWDGNELLKYMREYERLIKKEPNRKCADLVKAAKYEAYVVGVFDATNYMYKDPKRTAAKQVCAIVTKYLKEHPERWNKPASYLVMCAFGQAFGLDAEYIKRGCK